MSNPRCGWTPPKPHQMIRALMRAHPSAGDSILSDVEPAPMSDLSAATCDLDQGQLGSCTANGIAQAVYVAEFFAGFTSSAVLSRLWLYYEERALEGTTAYDVGACIGDGFAMLAAKGIPDETIYPYDISKFAQDPGPAVDMAAFDSRGQVGINYHPIGSRGEALLTDVEKALTSGHAVVFGCTVSEAFCSTQPSGTVQAPSPTDEIAGGHCMAVVGHDRANRRFKIKNSWSNAWGDPDAGPGCFWMDYSYFIDAAFGANDIWLVLVVPAGGRK